MDPELLKQWIDRGMLLKQQSENPGRADLQAFAPPGYFGGRDQQPPPQPAPPHGRTGGADTVQKAWEPPPGQPFSPEVGAVGRNHMAMRRELYLANRDAFLRSQASGRPEPVHLDPRVAEHFKNYYHLNDAQAKAMQHAQLSGHLVNAYQLHPVLAQQLAGNLLGRTAEPAPAMMSGGRDIPEYPMTLGVTDPMRSK